VTQFRKAGSERYGETEKSSSYRMVSNSTAR
jgi:hypothetical protein